MLKIAFSLSNIEDKQQIEQWLNDFLQNHFIEVSIQENPHLYLMEILHLYDWVKLNRIRKKQPQCMIIPIVAQTLVHSAPLAIELGLPYLLTKPIQKAKFLRAAKKIQQLFEIHSQTTISYQELSTEMTTNSSCPFQEAFLRRLVRGEVENEIEFIEARSFLKEESIPNTVIFMQGFFKKSDTVQPIMTGSKIIMHVLQQAFKGLTTITFLPFNNYLLLLIKVPLGYDSFKDWSIGVQIMKQAVELLKEQYNLYIYMGIGGLYQKPLDLHLSYSQARKARKKPPLDYIHIRFFEDLTQLPFLQDAILYIEQHCHEHLQINDVARHINFSPTHFGRILKKETGRSFPEYVAFTRIIQSLPLLRHSNETVEKIAADFGFNTPNYYSNIFKKIVTLSPSEYRNTEEIMFK